jgi:hypothetical protein
VSPVLHAEPPGVDAQSPAPWPANPRRDDRRMGCSDPGVSKTRAEAPPSDSARREHIEMLCNAPLTTAMDGCRLRRGRAISALGSRTCIVERKRRGGIRMIPIVTDTAAGTTLVGIVARRDLARALAPHRRTLDTHSQSSGTQGAPANPSSPGRRCGMLRHSLFPGWV